jgi:hypothetical protein
MKVFVPLSDDLPSQMIEALGLCSADLVPFQLDYPCVPVALNEAFEPHDAEVVETEI